MTVKFYGTIDSQNNLEMDVPFFRNNWEHGDLLQVTRPGNDTISFRKVKPVAILEPVEMWQEKEDWGDEGEAN